jgi:hypothetical protein
MTTTSSFAPLTHPTSASTIHDKIAEMLTNEEVKISELLAPIVLPNNPVISAPISGKKTIEE